MDELIRLQELRAEELTMLVKTQNGYIELMKKLLKVRGSE